MQKLKKFEEFQGEVDVNPQISVGFSGTPNNGNGMGPAYHKGGPNRKESLESPLKIEKHPSFLGIRVCALEKVFPFELLYH